MVSQPLHWISDLVVLAAAAFGALTPVDGAQRSLLGEPSAMARTLSRSIDERLERAAAVLSASFAGVIATNNRLSAAGGTDDGAEAAPGPKAQERLAQSVDSSGENDELFARAAEQVPKWKNPAEGLLPSGDSTVAGPAVDGAAKAAADGAAGTPQSGKPGILDKRKDASRAPGGTIGRRIAAGEDKALGALPPNRRQALGSPALVGARANETVAIRRPTETARPDERTAIQSVIRQQLDAFASDDGASAYSSAAPSVRTYFPDQAGFLRMVRERYAVVYRHKQAQFGELSERGEQRIQAVRLTDHDGELWTAVYTLEKQPDGSWLISGCTLTKGDRA